MADAAAHEEDPTQVEISAADGTGAKLDTVTVHSGEEQDEVLWKARAKAYRFDEGENEWKERGLGEIRFLKNKETGKVRLLMRREGVHKVCIFMNMADVGPITVHAGSDKSWVWTGMDYSESDDPTRETIACKFPAADVAQQFKEHYERHCPK